MPSFLRRLLDRPSGRVSRAVLVPLTLLYALVVAYALLVVWKAGDRLDTEKLAASAETLARTWDEDNDAINLMRLADISDWDRVWVVSATGRIVSSSRIGEEGAVLDAVFWDDLPGDQILSVRSVDQGGQTWTQVAARDMARGMWAMIVTRPAGHAVPTWLRLSAVLLLALVVWLLMASAVLTVVHRRLGRGYDAADDMAARILGGEAISSSTLNRERADLAEEGAPSRMLALAARLQEQAERAREAESRFAASIDVIPDAAYLASFDGRLLLAGSGFRRRMQDPGRPLQGRPLDAIETDLPVMRVHEAASRLRDAGMTVDRMPIETVGDVVQASVRPVTFRGIDAYLAHIAEAASSLAADPTFGGSTARDLLDASEDLFIAFDAEARTILWNRAAERLTGLTRQEVPDLRHVVECMLPTPESSIPFMDWLESQPGAGDLEGTICAKDGTEQRVRWHAHELLTDGSVVGGALVARVLGPVEAASPVTTRSTRSTTRKTSRKTVTNPKSKQVSTTAKTAPTKTTPKKTAKTTAKATQKKTAANPKPPAPTTSQTAGPTPKRSAKKTTATKQSPARTPKKPAGTPVANPGRKQAGNTR